MAVASEVADSMVAVSAAAGSMAAGLRGEASAAGALRDEVLQQADLGAPASREVAPWLLAVLVFAASVSSGDLVGAVPHGVVRHGAGAGRERAGAVAGDGAGLLRPASRLVSSLRMPGTGAIRMRAMTSVWSGTASLG